MTISTTSTTVTYIGNGATTVFTFPFVGDDPSDITVVYTDAADNQTTLGTSTYSITFNPIPVGGLWAVGGSVHYPLIGLPISTGTFLTITRTLPLTQEVTISNQGAFYPQAVEQALDILEMQIQQVSDSVNENTFPPLLSRENKAFYFDSAGLPIASVATGTEIDAVALAYATSGQITAGTLGTVSTTAALLTLFPVGVSLTNGAGFVTGARSVVGDRGGAIFYYAAGDTTTADNGGTIRVDTQGRRFKVATALTVPAEVFGAKGDGSTDDTAAINSALVAGALAGFTVLLSGKTYKCNSTITFDWSLTGLQGLGTTVDHSGLSTTGTGYQFFTTWPDPNTMGSVHNTRPFQGIYSIGPSFGTTGSTLFAFTASTISGSPWFVGGTFMNVGATGWGVFVQVSNGVFFQEFFNCTFGGTTTHSSYFFIENIGTVNSGENISFHHCVLTNLSGGALLDNGAGANADFFFDNCSVDATPYIMSSGTRAAPNNGTGSVSRLVMQGGHIEYISQSDYTIIVAANGEFLAEGVSFVFDGGGSTHSPFLSNGTVLDQGIKLRDCRFAGPKTWSTSGLICDGTGRFTVEGLSTQSNTFNNFSAASCNVIPDYKFTSTPIATGRFTGGTYNTSIKPSGATGSIQINTASNSTLFKYSAKPAQVWSYYFQYEITGISGDNYVFSLVALDANGAVLATLGGQTFSVNQATFAVVATTAQLITPPGTAQVGMLVQYSGSGSANFYLAEPILNGI